MSIYRISSFVVPLIESVLSTHQRESWGPRGRANHLDTPPFDDPEADLVAQSYWMAHRRLARPDRPPVRSRRPHSGQFDQGSARDLGGCFWQLCVALLSRWWSRTRPNPVVSSRIAASVRSGSRRSPSRA